MLDLSFLLMYICWALLPDTQTPRFEIASIPVNSKDIINIAIACLYFLLPAVKNSRATKHNLNINWHSYLPLLTVSLLLYAAASVEWSGMNKTDSIAMRYTLLLTGAACLVGYYLIAKRDSRSVHPFIWRLTVLLSVVGLLYTAQSFFSLGLTTPDDFEAEQFGIQRVRGPLFVSTTGFFILLPALAFAIQEFIKSHSHRLFKASVVFSLVITIIGLGARTGLILLAIFFLLLMFFMKNNKQAKMALVIMIIVTMAAILLFFSKAKTDRLQSLEDTTRSDTYLTSFQIIQHRTQQVNIFGSGYGSYWPWYIPDFEGARETNQYFDLVWNPYGSLLYHPHSTFLLCIVELGIPGLIYFVCLWTILYRLLLSNLQSAEFSIFNCGIFASGFSMFFDFFIFRSAQVNTLWWIFLFGALALNFNVGTAKAENNKHSR